MKQVFFLLVLLIAGFHVLQAQSDQKKISEDPVAIPRNMITMSIGAGSGFSFDNRNHSGVLLDFPINIHFQRRFGKFSLGGGFKLQHITGWEEDAFGFHAGPVHHTLGKFFGRGEFTVITMRKGFLGISAEGGSFRVLSGPGITTSDAGYGNIGGFLLMNMSKTFQLMIEANIEVNHYKTTIWGEPVNLFIITNQYLIGLRMNIQ